jgi:hypothetical protein
MSGGFPLRTNPSWGWSLRSLLTYLAVLVVLAVMSGCTLFQRQPPAPIIDLSTPQPASETEAAEPEEEPASAPPAVQPASEAKPPHPKPKRRVVAPKPPPPPPPPPPEEKPPPPPPPPLITTRILQYEQVHGLLDSEVQRADGHVVGRAVDMYADTSGKPRLMVVNLSGFLGVGDRKVTFPWNAFKFNPIPGKPHVTFAPPPAPTPGAKTKVVDSPPKPGSLNDVPPTLAQLVDSTVTQKNGAKMGRVVDVLIDAEGAPQALVVDLSDSLAGDKRQVAANWPDLHVQMRNKVMTLQLNFTDAQIKAAPTYAPEQPVKIVSPVVAIPESAPAAAGVDTSAITRAASGAVSGTASGVASAPRPTK